LGSLGTVKKCEPEEEERRNRREKGLALIIFTFSTDKRFVIIRGGY
jgi:hypothetical protein